MYGPTAERKLRAMQGRSYSLVKIRSNKKSPQKDIAEVPLEASYRQFLETLSHGSLQEINGSFVAVQNYIDVKEFDYYIRVFFVKDKIDE